MKPFDLRLERSYHFVKPWETPVESPAVQAVSEAFRAFDDNPSIGGAPFSCDLALYGQAGMPAILLGPRGGNLHAPDEWVQIEDITMLTMVFMNLALSWCQRSLEIDS